MKQEARLTVKEQVIAYLVEEKLEEQKKLVMAGFAKLKEATFNGNDKQAREIDITLAFVSAKYAKLQALCK
jgi:hypothetical protein